MPPHFHICVLPRERPCNISLFGNSGPLPGVGFGKDGVVVWNAPFQQALEIQNVDFNWSQFRPTGVLRGAVKEQMKRKSVLVIEPEHLLETLANMGIVVVHKQMNTACFRIDLFE
jgi:hypothetical protein